MIDICIKETQQKYEIEFFTYQTGTGENLTYWQMCERKNILYIAHEIYIY